MEMMQKVEGHIPLHMKSFSDFSREYMKLLEHGFKINCSIENKIFGNMGIDNNSIKLFDEYLTSCNKFYSTQIDITGNVFGNYLKMRLTLMESYNNFVKEFANMIDATKQEKLD